MHAHRIFSFTFLVGALSSAVPNTRSDFLAESLVIFNHTQGFVNLTSRKSCGGASLINPLLISNPGGDWPKGTCGPNDAYGALDGVRKCAVRLNTISASESCNSVDHLDGPGKLHCAAWADGGSITAAIHSWSRTNISQNNTW